VESGGLSVSDLNQRDRGLLPGRDTIGGISRIVVSRSSVELSELSVLHPNSAYRKVFHPISGERENISELQASTVVFGPTRA
jgi:hypothetical protein